MKITKDHFFLIYDGAASLALHDQMKNPLPTDIKKLCRKDSPELFDLLMLCQTGPDGYANHQVDDYDRFPLGYQSFLYRIINRMCRKVFPTIKDT